MTAREFFESAAEASREIDRICWRLDAIDAGMEGVGSPSFEPRVSGGNGLHATERRLARAIDEKTVLEARLEKAYDLIDAANAVLYGDGFSDGLAALVPPWWADALALHYLNGETWASVGKALGYSESHVKQRACAAFDVLDAHGVADSMAGRGFAEDDV